MCEAVAVCLHTIFSPFSLCLNNSPLQNSPCGKSTRPKILQTVDTKGTGPAWPCGFASGQSNHIPGKAHQNGRNVHLPGSRRRSCGNRAGSVRGHLGTADDPALKDRKIGSRVVTAVLFEMTEHLIRPVWITGFKTGHCKNPRQRITRHGTCCFDKEFGSIFEHQLYSSAVKEIILQTTLIRHRHGKHRTCRPVPIRIIVQSPAGTSQSSVPSALRFSVNLLHP